MPVMRPNLATGRGCEILMSVQHGKSGLLSAVLFFLTVVFRPFFPFVPFSKKQSAVSCLSNKGPVHDVAFIPSISFQSIKRSLHIKVPGKFPGVLYTLHYPFTKIIPLRGVMPFKPGI